MKDIWGVLDRSAMRSEPRVWIKRLIIIDQRGEGARFIRDIPLKRGLNIVWAKEPEEDDSAEPITGHSAGKTSFCRLLRYCLGESTYATKVNKKLLAKSFKHGYVGAELIIDSKQYNVLRPIGDNASSYYSQEISLDELAKTTGVGNRLYQQNYAGKLGLREILEEDLASSQILKTEEEIKYEHILAWCTRDQEARYQNIHTWRAARSESDTPSFSYKREGPLFAMRVILGLFLDTELKKEEDLAKKQKRLGELEKEIEDKKKEPLFLYRSYRNNLNGKLIQILGEEQRVHIEEAPIRNSDDLIYDLERLKEKAKDALADQSVDFADRKLGIDERLRELDYAIRTLDESLSEYGAFLDEKTKAQLNLDQDFKDRQSDRQTLSDVMDKECIAGVLYKDCEYVLERIKKLQVLETHDGRQREKAEADRAKELKTLKAHIEPLQEKRKALDKERTALNQAKIDLQNEQRAVPASPEQLDELFVNICANDGWHRNPDRFIELQKLNDEQKLVELQIRELEIDLSDLIKDHSGSRKRLNSVFNGAVRQVLPGGEYKGRVDFDKRDLFFHIIRGTAISGEAITTLSVLLSDISCMLYAALTDEVMLPGFVLHDSPREADLGIRLYRKYFKFIQALEDHFGGAESCPFQYIITTTTPPPPEMENDDNLVRLQLNAGISNELLFRRNLSEPIEEPKPEALEI